MIGVYLIMCDGFGDKSQMLTGTRNSSAGSTIDRYHHTLTHMSERAFHFIVASVTGRHLPFPLLRFLFNGQNWILGILSGVYIFKPLIEASFNKRAESLKELQAKRDERVAVPNINTRAQDMRTVPEAPSHAASIAAK